MPEAQSGLSRTAAHLHSAMKAAADGIEILLVDGFHYLALFALTQVEGKAPRMLPEPINRSTVALRASVTRKTPTQPTVFSAFGST